MKLLSVRANRPEFNTVNFTDGFNVILAERAQDSTDKDSRNGLGKTTLIEIIHFCLGGSAKPQHSLRSKELEGWVFTLEFQIQDEKIIVSRSTTELGYVMIHPDTDWSAWEVQPTFNKKNANEARIKVTQWRKLLGSLVFGLSFQDDGKYKPKFRALINYKARRKHFDKPFENAQRQQPWDQKLHNAILLDLNWTFVHDWQMLKLRKDHVDSLKRASRGGDSVLARIVGTISELDNEKVRLEQRIATVKDELDNFRVHSQYEAIQREANDITEAVHSLTNNILQNRRLIEYYEQRIGEEQSTSDIDVSGLYEQAGVDLPNSVVKRIEDVREFHSQIVENRKEYLNSEIQRLRNLVHKETEQRDNLSDQRARSMSILAEYGALKEYTSLQGSFAEMVSQLSQIQARIEQLKLVQIEDSQIKIEKQQLKLDALADFEERTKVKEARRIFNDNSEKLYEASGNLNIDIRDSGYSFDINIMRDGSDGVDKMKVFCYDLMIAELWAGNINHPQFLIHDSTIFADVDERQFAKALSLAKEKSEKFGFQYIITLNSDKVPWTELSEYFDINSYVRLILTDDKPEGSLLGIRF